MRIAIVFVIFMTFQPIVFGQKAVIIEPAIRYNNLLLPTNAMLNITSVETGDSAVYGSTTVTDAAYTNVFLSGDSTYNMKSNWENLIFELSFDSIDSCRTIMVELGVNNLLSSFDTLIITQLNFMPHTFFYADSILCQDAHEELPITDIPLSDIMLESAGGISFGPEWELQPFLSSPGDYFVKLETEYCLYPWDDQIQLTILPSAPNDFTDPISVCSGSLNDEYTGAGYLFYDVDGGLSGDPIETLEESGTYIIQHASSECVSLDTVEVIIIEPAEIEVIAEDLCDHIALTLESYGNNIDSVQWWNSASGASTTADASGNVWVEARDENNCTVSANLDITFEPLAITGVNYSVENATCWDEGIVSDLEVSLQYEVAGASYQLVNTIDGGVVSDYYSVQEGIYKVQAFDDKGCVVESDQQITVLQDCLNEYPVFTPDSDGVEDEYFIPHEGTIKIYDRSGKLLREISTPAYWDGKDDAGNHLPMGNYVLLTETGRAVNITIVR